MNGLLIVKQEQRPSKTFRIISSSILLGFSIFCLILIGKAVDGTAEIFLGVIVGICVLCVTVFNSMKLTVTLDDEFLCVNYFPLHLCCGSFTVKTSDIEFFRDVSFNALTHCGGWGIRFSKRFRKAYVMKSGKGIHVRTRNNKEFMFSIDDPQPFLDKFREEIDIDLGYRNNQ
eukprot:TRINITY_DN14629_c0_g1_i1.p1 TRINITY_DN14629_c0_g1~~TRINITY_DN14629_c0_g1_i1.p1  ORF type:complete len:173 (+),score=38.03 TRINITY_DN14629_c0_g1_i1:69-587(+)